MFGPIWHARGTEGLPLPTSAQLVQLGARLFVEPVLQAQMRVRPSLTRLFNALVHDAHVLGEKRTRDCGHRNPAHGVADGVVRGHPADALEPHFTCRLCEDTGIVDGRTCSCVHKVMQQLRRSEIEALSSLSISSFDTMELRYYPARMDASLGEPVRSYMSTLLDDLRGYADEFDTTSESLMLLGNAGLGKTHAALAIAGEVLEKGFDVIYVSSPDFFSKLEALHFGSDPAGEEEMLLRTAAGADLLILDDLGSEFNSSFLISTLYSLLNNRLGAKLPTIVTTNITDGALLEKLYTEKISSRLSSFVPFLFMGDDIRAQKAEEA